MKDITFNNLDRPENIDRISNTLYELIIIGGGITGAGIALDAALRGIKTLLIEKKDFAAGTSSKSTKLIHGGLRYLKQLELGLVKETGQERAVAHQNIPHLVHPEKMLLPIVKEGTFGKITASIAISVYDILANVPSEDKKKLYNKEEILREEPLLNRKKLKSGIIYSEYRTDDARLTIELVKAARREGAEALNYLQVDDFIYKNGKVRGVVCTDHTNGKTVEVKGQQVVSAAGPWVDDLRVINKSKQGKSLQLTKGIHIVVPHSVLPINSSVYFDAFDGRMLFAIPRGKITYVGTSDTVYTGDKDTVVCSRADADYILDAVNVMFEVEPIQFDQIISTWAGLRPLIHEDGKSASELSRKDEIFVSDTELISIAGGKLTGFRKMAMRIIDLVQERNKSFAQTSCKTEEYDIHSDSFVDYSEFKQFKATLKSKYAALSDYDIWYMATTFGKHADLIIQDAKSRGGNLEEDLIKAEIQYSIENESSYLPDDYFNRRSGRLYFDIHSLTKHFDLIIEEFQSYFKWDDKNLSQITEQSRRYIEEVTQIKS